MRPQSTVAANLGKWNCLLSENSELKSGTNVGTTRCMPKLKLKMDCTALNLSKVGQKALWLWIAGSSSTIRSTSYNLWTAACGRSSFLFYHLILHGHDHSWIVNLRSISSKSLFHHHTPATAFQRSFADFSSVTRNCWLSVQSMCSWWNLWVTETRKQKTLAVAERQTSVWRMVQSPVTIIELFDHNS